MLPCGKNCEKKKSSSNNSYYNIIKKTPRASRLNGLSRDAVGGPSSEAVRACRSLANVGATKLRIGFWDIYSILSL